MVQLNNYELPIGSIIPWNEVGSYSHKFVECDGTVLDMPDSPMNGCTLPSLNDGNGRYLRGNDMDGGVVGGAETHRHILNFGGGWEYSASGGVGALGPNGLTTGTASNIPASYSVVFLIKVK